MSARSLVLSLLASTDAVQLTIGTLIKAGSLFDIEAATMRVAVTRLMSTAHLKSPQRGVYVPGPKARALTSRVQQWKDVNSRKCDWNGDWLVALTQHLGRTDRKQLRARERALGLSGYRETPQGFWIRPANLSRPLSDHRDDLVDIGADEDLLIHRVSATATAEEKRWASLWSTEALRESYDRAIRTMEESLNILPDLTVPMAARETFLIGQSVIRSINFDPLLPPELGPDDRFCRMVETMRRYNDVGVSCWKTFRESV
ncbi:hypothetical protein WNY37_00260 [Henriciella sp. AS95]|uniref:hypothetical protein n=1 Tax=Henriciella sp. AS95 TaxID=3135782 RepID=UPI003177A571